MASSPPNGHVKKPIRELSSITNHLLLTKTLNALVNNNGNAPPAPAPSTSSIKENIPNDPSSVQQQKALNLRLAAALKPVDRDNVAALLQFYQTLTNTNNVPSNGHPNSSIAAVESSSSVGPPSHFHSVSKQLATKRTSSMSYLCRFNQRNRLIEVPLSSDYYHPQNGISHEHLKHLIMHEFQLQKSTLIIQLWNEQYQEYIDIESYKKIPLEGRLQVLIEQSAQSTANSPSVASKSPTTPISSNNSIGAARSLTPIPLQTTPGDHPHDDDVPMKSSYEEPASTVSPLHPMDNLGPPQHNLMYDLLPKPSEGIPIPRFPPHIAAFLNGSGDANQLNALVQALYQEIVKYELYPNADELRSIVSRLVDRHPNSISVIGSVELLVRKLYYKFCNERKKYPVELKRRQPNKRKRLIRDDDSNNASMVSLTHSSRPSHTMNDLDRLMHLWTTTHDGKECAARDIPQQQQQHDGFNSPQHSPSGSSSGSASPVSTSLNTENHPPSMRSRKHHPLNLSLSTNSNLPMNPNLMHTD